MVETTASTSLPSIRRVYVRILLFYIGGVAVIGLLVPYTNPDLNLDTSTAAKSPFVIAIKAAGIKGLPSVINAALLTSAWSAASSDVYSSSRALCACSRFVEAFFLNVTRPLQMALLSIKMRLKSSYVSTGGVFHTLLLLRAAASDCLHTWL